MRYPILSALAVLGLSALPAQAISGRSIESCTSSAAGTKVAQGRCYQVVRYVAPSPLRCQQVGVDHLGRPIWLCCE
jgi:hypothetical protein